MNKKHKIASLKSAGGVVYKQEGNKIKWLIIKPAGRKEWRLPKGVIESNETSVRAAIREVQEEGGVIAAIKEKVGQIRYFYTQDGEKFLKEVIFFLMEYLEGNPEEHDDEVEKAMFVPFDQAYNKLSYETEKEILVQANEILKKKIEEEAIEEEARRKKEELKQEELRKKEEKRNQA
ncbi:MAG: NUDIX domain-containing protein [bacterium]|nr:NUDIX domain-containing protein [bacterium]